MRKLISAVTIAAVGGALAIPALAAETKTVRLKSNPDRFSPRTVEVKQGDKVKFVWSQGTHDVAATDSRKKPWPNIGVRRAGSKSVTRTADKRGTFALECTLHSGMNLTVKVKRR